MLSFEISKENAFFQQVSVGALQQVIEAIDQDPQLGSSRCQQNGTIFPIHIAAYQGNGSTAAFLGQCMSGSLPNAYLLASKLSPYALPKVRSLNVFDFFAINGHFKALNTFYKSAIEDKFSTHPIELFKNTLGLAALKGHLAFVLQMLEAYPALASEPNIVGSILEGCAQGNHRDNALELIKVFDAQNIAYSVDDLLIGAAKGGHEAFIRQLLKSDLLSNGAVDNQTFRSRMVLTAAQYGRFGLVKQLGVLWKDLELGSLTRKGASIFHLAAQCPGVSIDALLQFYQDFAHDMSPLAKDLSGHSILHHSIIGGNIENAFCLAQKYPELNLHDVNRLGQSLLDIFLVHEHALFDLKAIKQGFRRLIGEFGFTRDLLEKFKAAQVSLNSTDGKGPHTQIKLQLMTCAHRANSELFEKCRLEYWRLKGALLTANTLQNFKTELVHYFGFFKLPMMDKDGKTYLLKLIELQKLDSLTLYLNFLNSGQDLNYAYRFLLGESVPDAPLDRLKRSSEIYSQFKFINFSRLTDPQKENFHLAVARCQVPLAFEHVCASPFAINTFRLCSTRKHFPYYKVDLQLILKGLMEGKLCISNKGPHLAYLLSHVGSKEIGTTGDMNTTKMIILLAKTLGRNTLVSRYSEILSGGDGLANSFEILGGKPKQVGFTLFFQAAQQLKAQQQTIKVLEDKLKTQSTYSSKCAAT